MIELCKRTMGLIVALAFMNAACFSSYTISTSELELLQSGNEAEQVSVCVSAAETGDEPLRLAQADGEIPSQGCEAVEVSLTNTLSVVTNDGVSHRVTPFNFTLSDTQLVSPDYDLLLSREAIEGAEIQVFSTGKTVGLVAGVTALAVGAFVLLSVLAPAERGLGGT